MEQIMPLRAKHIPLRSCITCRTKTDKRGLVRVVRTPDGAVSVDPTGRTDGRGAYLCHHWDCWEVALRRGKLSRALRSEPSETERAALEDYAETLTGPEPSVPAQRSG